MSTGSGSPASRRARGRWLDPRLVIGLALVVLSVVGVLWVVAAADGGTNIYVARSALSPGDRITASDLIVRSVRLGDAAGHYLAPRDLDDEGVVVTRAVAAGDLVPASAVGTAAGDRVTSVVVTQAARLSRAITPGAVVDVWSAAETSNGVFAVPTVLVASATIVRVIESDGIIAGNSAQSIEILVPRGRTARVLEAIANKDAISLVPTSIPLRDQ